MSVIAKLQKGILYLKDAQDALLLAMLTSEDYFYFLLNSPLYFVLLPLFGIFLLALAALRGYQLTKAINKNFDGWFAFLTALSSAVLGSTAVFGYMIAAAFHLSFAAAPAILLASIVVTFSYQLIMAGVDFYRAKQSPAHSQQRLDYIKTGLQHLFLATLLILTATAVYLLILSPALYFVGSACALTAAVLTLGHVFWRVIPAHWQQAIIRCIVNIIPALKNLCQPTEQATINTATTNSSPIKKAALTPVQHYDSLFVPPNYCDVVRNATLEEAQQYLQQVIEQKNGLATSPKPQQQQQWQLLNYLTKSKSIFCLKQLAKDFPLAFQSFWTNKSEFEELVTAILMLHKKAVSEEQKKEMDKPSPS